MWLGVDVTYNNQILLINSEASLNFRRGLCTYRVINPDLEEASKSSTREARVQVQNSMLNFPIRDFVGGFRIPFCNLLQA